MARSRGRSFPSLGNGLLNQFCFMRRVYIYIYIYTFDPVYEHDKYFQCLVGAAALAAAPMAQRRVGVRRVGAARRAGSPLPAGGI